MALDSSGSQLWLAGCWLAMLAVVVGVGAADPCMAGGCDDCSGLAVACRGTSILVGGV